MKNYSIDMLDARCAADVLDWEAIVDKSAFPDAYYRPGYVLACREVTTQRICALVISAAGFRVLLPLIVAELCIAEGGRTSIHRHAYSPYGYGGMLPLDRLCLPTAEQIVALREALQGWSRQNDVVCVVVRMHPIMGQELWFEQDDCDDAILRLGNVTTAVDLESWNDPEQCIASLKAERRRNLLSARRKLRVSWASGGSENIRQSLQVFQSLYNDCMRSLGAEQFYLFPDDYYQDLARGLGQRLGVGLAFRGDDPAAGSLFMADASCAHYHLSASNDEGRKTNATTLLINAGALWARGRGCTKLHLGGGLKGEDSLFRFKHSFGGSLFRYATLTVVADRTAFASLCDKPSAPWPYALHRRATVDSVNA